MKEETKQTVYKSGVDWGTRKKRKK